MGNGNERVGNRRRERRKWCHWRGHMTEVHSHEGGHSNARGTRDCVNSVGYQIEFSGDWISIGIRGDEHNDTVCGGGIGGVAHEAKGLGVGGRREKENGSRGRSDPIREGSMVEDIVRAAHINGKGKGKGSCGRGGNAGGVREHLEVNDTGVVETGGIDVLEGGEG